MRKVFLFIFWVGTAILVATAVQRGYDWAVYRRLCAHFAEQQGIPNVASLQFEDISDIGRTSRTRSCTMIDTSTNTLVDVPLPIAPVMGFVMTTLLLLKVSFIGVPFGYGIVRACQAGSGNLPYPYWNKRP